MVQKNKALSTTIRVKGRAELIEIRTSIRKRKETQSNAGNIRMVKVDKMSVAMKFDSFTKIIATCIEKIRK